MRLPFFSARVWTVTLSVPKARHASRERAEALRRILRKPRDQIHIYMGEVILFYKRHGRGDVRGCVAPANGLQHRILHRLRIYGDQGDAVGL